MECSKCKSKNVTEMACPESYPDLWWRCDNCKEEFSTPKEKNNLELDKRPEPMSREQSETVLIEKGYIKTEVFGWITTKELIWLNQKLKLAGWDKTTEDLNGFPAKEALDKKGNTITVMEDFVLEFSDRKVRERINNDGFQNA